MLKASFTITKGHKQGDRHIESGVAGMKTLGEDDSNIGMRMLIGAGFVCVGLSIYIRSRGNIFFFFFFFNQKTSVCPLVAFFFFSFF